jgi:hypothetical protein
LSKRLKILKYNQLFFLYHIGNLTAIYDVSFFWENQYRQLEKTGLMVVLTILQQIKTAKPVPEA